MHMLCDAENQQVEPAGDVETKQCLAERKVQAFAHRMNGGYKTKKAREFQNALWYYCSSSPRASSAWPNPSCASRRRTSQRRASSPTSRRSQASFSHTAVFCLSYPQYSSFSVQARSIQKEG
ncbi:unnamed protein product [Ectocarpus sp. CCAP 1310/34]|nr:unnamed protein product [Ectocarpus sp. CCAP 1310/34]